MGVRPGGPRRGAHGVSHLSETLSLLPAPLCSRAPAPLPHPRSHRSLPLPPQAPPLSWGSLPLHHLTPRIGPAWGDPQPHPGLQTLHSRGPQLYTQHWAETPAKAPGPSQIKRSCVCSPFQRGCHPDTSRGRERPGSLGATHSLTKLWSCCRTDLWAWSNKIWGQRRVRASGVCPHMTPEARPLSPQVRTRERPAQPHPHRAGLTGSPAPRPGSAARGDSCDHLPVPPTWLSARLEANAVPDGPPPMAPPHQPGQGKRTQSPEGHPSPRPWEATWGMPSPAVRGMELPSNLAWGQGGASLQHRLDPESDPSMRREHWDLTRNRQTDTWGRTSHPALVYF